MKLPPGFSPISLKGMLERFQQEAPQLGPALWEHLKVPEAQARLWIATLEEQDVVQFAIAPTGEPSSFIAPEQAFTNPADYKLASDIVSYWDTTGKYDSGNGRIVSADLPPNMSQIFTPEGPVAVAEQVALRLWKLGLITEHAGRLVAPSKIQLYAWTQEQGICDFCSTPHPKHVVLVPDFEMMPGVAAKSEGGWMACDTCHAMVTENRRTDLLRRAIEGSSGGRFTAAALEGLHKRFWKQHDLKIEAAGIGLGLTDFIEDRLSPEKEFINPKLQEKARRLEAIRRMTGLSRDELDAMQRGDVLHKETAQKLQAWRRKYHLDTNSPEGQRRITEFLNTMDRPVPPTHQPHWQVALDKKLEAYQKLAKLAKFDGAATNPSDGLVLDISEDVTALKVADVYSFNADTMHAIREGAKSIPCESPLKSVEMPNTLAGWFWFAEPLPVASAPVSADCTHALLWTWEPKMKHPTIRFSAYVVDEKGELETNRGTILPSTKWYWPIDLSFHEMLAYNSQMYKQAYAPGTPYTPGKEMALGEEHTLKCLADMSLFFMMACLWFRQTVPGTKRKVEPKLTQEDGHIERHARKRVQKEFGLGKQMPVVRVVALRKSAVEAVEHEETGEGGHKLTVRCIVRGHPRLQACGPGMQDRKLIWIDPYIKGPEDAPFKESGPRVFAVIR